MDMVATQKSGGSMSSGPITSFVDKTWDELVAGQVVLLDAYSRDIAKSILRTYFTEVFRATPPPFPPHTEQIEALKKELTLQREISRLAGEIIEQKDQQMLEMKDRIKAQKGVQQAELDRLTGIISRQRDEIVALKSNPMNEEARFNIERKYEREFTSVAHLNQKITDLEVEITLLKRVISQRDETIESLKVEARTLPTTEEAVREALDRTARTLTFNLEED